jgi:hypothetical protein
MFHLCGFLYLDTIPFKLVSLSIVGGELYKNSIVKDDIIEAGLAHCF